MRNNRQPLTYRRSIRLHGYDYSKSGAYFVTLSTYNKVCIFGEVTCGEMRLNMLGSVVSHQWQRNAQVRSSIKLDAFVVMPNHLHGILFILDDNNRNGSSQLEDRNMKRKSTLQSGSLGAIIGQFKSAVTRQARRLNVLRGIHVWQRNYYEHIIRSEESLNEIRKYILENPARWTEDDLYVEPDDW